MGGKGEEAEGPPTAHLAAQSVAVGSLRPKLSLGPRKDMDKRRERK